MFICIWNFRDGSSCSYIFIGCTKTDKEYVVNGVIHDIKIDEQIIIIDHDSIPGFMMSMIMPFKFKNKEDVEDLSSGDSVRFKLVVKSDDSYVLDFNLLGRSITFEDPDDFWDDDAADTCFTEPFAIPREGRRRW